MKRPLGVTLLAILYTVASIALILSGLLSSHFNPYVVIPLGVVLAVLSAGIWKLKRWARVGALILAGLNVAGSVVFVIYLMGESTNAVLPAVVQLIFPVLINVRIFVYLRQFEVEQAFGLYDPGLPTSGFTCQK